MSQYAKLAEAPSAPAAAGVPATYPSAYLPQAPAAASSSCCSAQHYVVTGSPMLALHAQQAAPRAPAPGVFTHGLCESLQQDCAVSCFSCLLPCCAYGLVYEMLATEQYLEPKFVCSPPCGAYFILQSFGWIGDGPKMAFGWILGSHQRAGLRSKFGLAAETGCCAAPPPAGPASSGCAAAKRDWLSHIFCQPCALTQEQLELRSRLPHARAAPAAAGGLGGDGAVLMAPAMPEPMMTKA